MEQSPELLAGQCPALHPSSADAGCGALRGLGIQHQPSCGGREGELRHLGGEGAGWGVSRRETHPAPRSPGLTPLAPRAAAERSYGGAGAVRSHLLWSQRGSGWGTGSCFPGKPSQSPEQGRGSIQTEGLRPALGGGGEGGTGEEPGVLP